MASLREAYDLIREAGAEVIAISADSVESHQRFAQSLGGVPFPLASDPEGEVAARYGVRGEGKRAQRALFVIDGDGRVLFALPWFSPGNPGHLLAVLQALGVPA